MSSSDFSPDESGYVTGRVSRSDPNHEEYDPSEHSYDEDTADSSARSPTPVPAPPVAAHGMRFRIFARKSVPLPVRVSFSAPTGEVGESSRRRPRSGTSPPATGAPAGHPSGMSRLESLRVSGLARDSEIHQARLDYHHQTIEELMATLNTKSEVIDRAMDIIISTRRSVRRLLTYLIGVLGVLVAMLGVLIWVVMH